MNVAKDKHNMLSTEDCTSMNSDRTYSEGYVFVRCSCGWSNKAKSKDAVLLYSTHVMQQLNKAEP